MKVAVVLLTFVVCALAQNKEQKEKIKHHVKFCSKKVGITEEEGKSLVYAVVDGNKVSNRCFMQCYVEQTGFMDNKGIYQKKVMLEKVKIALEGTVHAETINLIELIDTCTKLTANGECGAALELHNCYWKKILGQ